MGIGVGTWSLIWLPRDVASSRFFTDAHKNCAAQRMMHEKTEISWIQGMQVLRDWKIWALAGAVFLCGVGSASSSNFLPVMIKRLTDDTIRANLLTIGPNLVAATIMMSVSWFSDRTQQRAYFALGSIAIALVGWVLLAALNLLHRTELGYFFTYLTTGGTFIPLLLIPAWVGANTRSTSERAVALGLLSMFQNLGGIVSSAVYRAQDAPIYRPALLTVSGCLGGFLVITAIMRFVYSGLNRGLREGVEGPKGFEPGAKYMV
ncbi:major facilitator superfamily domain-containing protein [Aspergillus heterothallicus]